MAVVLQKRLKGNIQKSLAIAGLLLRFYAIMRKIEKEY